MVVVVVVVVVVDVVVVVAIVVGTVVATSAFPPVPHAASIPPPRIITVNTTPVELRPCARRLTTPDGVEALFESILSLEVFLTIIVLVPLSFFEFIKMVNDRLLTVSPIQPLLSPGIGFFPSEIMAFQWHMLKRTGHIPAILTLLM